MIICPDCRKSSPDGSAKCIHCGYAASPFGDDVWSKKGGVGNGASAEYQQSSDNTKGCLITLLFGVLTIVLFGVIFASCFSGSSSSTTKTSLTNAEAFTIAQMIVKDNLRAPSTAKFCSVVDAKITHTGLSYTVSGWVDAQNGFGAMIREDFTVTFTAIIKGKDVGYKNASVVFG